MWPGAPRPPINAVDPATGRGRGWGAACRRRTRTGSSRPARRSRGLAVAAAVLAGPGGHASADLVAHRRLGRGELGRSHLLSIAHQNGLSVEMRVLLGSG